MYKIFVPFILFKLSAIANKYIVHFCTNEMNKELNLRTLNTFRSPWIFLALISLHKVMSTNVLNMMVK